MAYTIEFRNKFLKTLIKINETYYSAIKKQIYDLADNPRPQGYRKLKGRKGYRIRVEITELSIRFLMIFC